MDLKELLSSFSLKREDQKPEPQNELEMTPEQEVAQAKLAANNKGAQQQEFNGSFLTSDLVVKGSISSKFDLCISGTIDGDVECEGDVSIFGSVNGNISANNVIMNQAKVTGNIKAKMNVTQKAGSSVTGDIDAECVEVNGSVNGNINAVGNAVFYSLAHITGNITSGSIAVKEDAVINGFMHINKERKNESE